jgi:hypothetical protein
MASVALVRRRPFGGRFRPIVTRTRTKLVAVARRGGRAALSAARDEKHTITALAAAGALGLAKRYSVDLPKIGKLGTAGTYGVGAYLVGRFTKSKTWQHVATGLLSVALHEMASGTSDMEGDEMSGDVDDVDE